MIQYNIKTSLLLLLQIIYIYSYYRTSKSDNPIPKLYTLQMQVIENVVFLLSQ